MKKKYIQPNVSVSFVVVESLLQTGSGGVGREEGGDWGTCSKKHYFTDDSFDNWPKDNSPWETDD